MKKNTTILVISVLAVIAVICAFYFGVTSKNSTTQPTVAGVNAAQACANQASIYFNTYISSRRLADGESFTYTNHFNESLGKCFIVITDLSTYTSESRGIAKPIGKMLYDVYENKQLAFDTKIGTAPEFCSITGGGDCTIIPIFSNDMESATY